MVQTVQKLEQQTLGPWFTKPGSGHAAQFYADELNLGRCALEYIHNGLLHQETCVVIATPEKLIALQKGLRRRGANISRLLSDNQYVTYDAEELLSGLMNDREIDMRQFNQFAIKLTRHVINAKRPVRVFGEMAALLRQQKNPNALLQLEHAFDRLSRSYHFSLYCAYPVLDERGEYGEIHKKIQQTHDTIFYC